MRVIKIKTMPTYFVYLLKSLNNGKFYTGYTTNFQKRLKYHNLEKNI
jgi:predicted GIY-YIG superfamily endonuclease